MYICAKIHCISLYTQDCSWRESIYCVSTKLSEVRKLSENLEKHMVSKARLEIFSEKLEIRALKFIVYVLGPPNLWGRGGGAGHPSPGKTKNFL